MTNFDIRSFARMWASERKEALGVKGTAHLPKEGTPAVHVHGILTYVATHEEASFLNCSRNKPQRVRAMCPVCDKNVAAGNLAQHYKTHTEEGRAYLALKTQRTREHREAMTRRWAERRVEPMLDQA